MIIRSGDVSAALFISSDRECLSYVYSRLRGDPDGTKLEKCRAVDDTALWCVGVDSCVHADNSEASVSDVPCYPPECIVSFGEVSA